MNKLCFKTVFSARLGTLVAVGEHANSQGKANGAHGAASPGAEPFGLTHIMSRFLGVLTASFVLVTLAWAQPALNALPKSGRVSQGAVQFSQSAQQLQITQSSDRAAVNWQSFDIGAAAKVNVVQPSAQSVLLNRVGGTAPSQIFGQLQANGKVILVNPNGMVFGQDGSVSAAAFTASTLNISDADFMAGNERYTRDGATGAIVNRGLIQTAPGGYVALLGASVSNEGQIVAPQGNVYMAAADAVRLPARAVAMPMGSSGRIRLELTPASINAAVANQKGGTIVTGGGQVYLQAAALNQAMASVLQSGSIDTTGEQGGAVHVLADGGTIKVDGRITANSSVTDDKGQTRKGGDIVIGRDTETAVLAKASDVSGAFLESNQGFVETSGDVLSTTGTRVKAGEWLLDPYNITIAASGASGTAYGSNFTSGADSVILASDISANLTAGTSVTIATGAGGASAGDIAVNESIAKTGGGDASLTLRAHGNITVAANKTITSNTGNLNVIFNSDFDANGSGAIAMALGSGITSNGGNIALGGGAGGSGAGTASGSASNPHGVRLKGAALSSGAGNVSITGTSYSLDPSNFGVLLDDGATINTTSGAVTINATGNTSGQYGYGMMIRGTGTIVATGSGNITVNATSSATGSGDALGILIRSVGAFTSTSGNISVTGTSRGTSGNYNQGVGFVGGSIVAGNTGTVTVVGVGSGATGLTSSGVDSANVTTTGASVTITGTSTSTGAGTVNISPGAISTSGGNITLTGNSYVGSGTESVNAGSGTFTIQNRTSTTTVNVGGTGTDTLTGTLGLDVSSTELAKITAGKIVVGRNDVTGSGAVTVSALNMGAMGNTGGSLSVLSKTDIAVNGSITKSTGTDATLSLLANGNIAVSAAITTAGSNILLQSTGGAISNTATISGRHVSIDNTGGTIDAATGALTKGSSAGTTGAAGISVGENITASGNLNMYGLTTNNIGINLGAAKTLSGGNLNAIGQTGSTYGVSMGAGASVVTTGTSGDSLLRGLGASVASGGMAALQMGNATLRAATGTTLTLNGQATTVAADVNTNTRGIRIEGTVDTYGDITLTGTSGSNDGFLIQSGQINIREGALKINGTIAANGGGFRSGVVISRPIYLYNGTSLAIVGKAANQSAAMSAGQPEFGVGITAVIAPAAGQTTTGNISITGYTSSVQNSGGVSISSDVSTGTGNITIIGQALGSSTGNSVTLGSNITSTSGDVTVQSIGGKIGLGSAKTVSARNITIDNTGAGLSSFIADTTAGLNLSVGTSMGGSINNATGAITPGSGKSAVAAANGITINGGLTASNNLQMYGVSDSANGVLSTAAMSGAYINATGKSLTSAVGYAWNGGNISTTGTGGLSTTSSVTGISDASVFTGTSGFGAFNMYASASATAFNGTSLNLDGNATAFAAGATTNVRGWRINGGSTLTTSGTINITGTSNNDDGLWVGGAITRTGAVSALTLTGNTRSTVNAGLSGVYLASGSVSGSTATGSITINGTATNTSGTTLDNAVRIAGAVTGGSATEVVIQSTNGNVVASSAISGLNISLSSSDSNVSTTNTGTITSGVGGVSIGSATAGTIAGVIDGTGPLTKTGAGLISLTATNTYTGITNINAGTLQVGSGGATGTLGSGGVSNNSALIFNRNATADLSVANAISGTGSVEQAGAGKTILSTNNSYSGATSVSGGILQVGNGGATGTLGTANSVALSNNATLAFNKNVNTTIDKSISGNGNVTANISGDLALTSNIALTGTNTINLTASGAITETAGSLAATNLYLTTTNGGIGAVGNRIQSNVTNLSFSGGADVYVTEANAVTVSGRTTANNGNIDVATTNGTMTIGSVNSVNGITANGTGNITLSGNTTTGNGISINNVITATNGNISLTGTTASTVNPNAGVYSQSTVTAGNITMVAEATSTSGTVLGYYGAGGVFNASQALSLTGTSRSSGNGLYSYTGSYLSGTGMTLVGTSTNGQAIGFDAGVTVTNSTSGGISMTGTATNASEQAFGLRGITVTNGGGNVSISANSGKIFSDAGNPAWGAPKTNTITNSGTGSVQVTAGNGSATNSGSIDGSVFTITQNANAGVVVSTSGTGNVTSPKIINAGTGDIVVAAGSAIAAGTATGGQVLSVAGNTLTQTNVAPGKTYVYSGAPSTTGVLSNLSTGFNNLYYQGTSAALNAGFNQGFDANHANDMAVPGGGSASEKVFFRTATKPSFSMTLSNQTKAYGETDPIGYASTNGATLASIVAGVGGNNTFAVTTADVLAGLTGGRAAGENVGSYAYSLSTGIFNTTLTAQPNLVIGRRDITLDSLAASNKVYDGSTLATITSGTFGNLFNGETLLISGQGLFSTKDVANGKTVTVADVSTLTKANGTGNWSNYSLTTTSKTTNANITKATLTATARDDAKFVTQLDVINFNGVDYSGFVGGDTPVVVDSTLLNIARTNAATNAAGNYANVLVPTGLSSVNYDFTYLSGNYRIVPAGTLLVRTVDKSLVYGASPTYDTTAQYLNGANVINTLTRSGTSNNYTFNDGAGTSVTMALKPYSGVNVATQSTSGKTAVGNYDVKDLAYTQTGNNFTGTPVFVGTLSVTPKEITPSATGVSKVYDATTSIANVVVGMTGKITNDVVAISGAGAFSQSTVGTNLGYSVTGVSLSSTDAGNYYLTNGFNSFSGTDGVITRASLVATANSRNATFNGAAQSVTGFTVAGLLGTDSVTGLVGISASGATGTNVGTYPNTMTVTNQTNYSVTGVNGALTIDPAPIGVTEISGALRGTVTKVYDGTTVATLTPANYILTGWLGTDGATVTKTLGSYNNANAGVGKTVTVSLSRSDYQASGSTDLSNYSLPTSLTGLVGVITPKNLSLSSFAAANKVYDGNNLATIISGNVLTGVGSETLSVRGTGSFVDKNAGNAKLVKPADVSALTQLDGSGSWLNYKLVNSNVTSTASITPKLIQASGSVGDKVYDGTVAATVNGMAAVGLLTGDTVYLQAGSADFADKDVSRDAAGNIASKVVTVSRLSLAGVDAQNYLLDRNMFTAQARITPRPLQLSAQALNKVYDTTPLATIKLGGLIGLVGTEQLQVMAAGAFENAEIGTNKLVNVRFDLGNGPNGGFAENYSLIPQTLRASITNQSAIPPLQTSAVSTAVKPATSAVTFAVKTATSDVTFSGAALAAVGERVSVQPSVVSCDLDNLEDCDCEPSKLDNVLICYVPREVTATGRMLPNNTGAFKK